MHTCYATASITYIVVIHCYLASILKRKMDCDDDLHFLIGSEDALERIDADPWLADDGLFELGYEYPLGHHRAGVVDRHLHRLWNLHNIERSTPIAK